MKAEISKILPSKKLKQHSIKYIIIWQRFTVRKQNKKKDFIKCMFFLLVKITDLLF